MISETAGAEAIGPQARGPGQPFVATPDVRMGHKRGKEAADRVGACEEMKAARPRIFSRVGT